MIGVKNNRPEGKENILRARYDGEDYAFPPGEVVSITLDAARHIFGYTEDDKTRALHRLGWLQNGGDREGALDKLNEFAFLEAEPLKFKDDKVKALPKKITGTLDPLAAGQSEQAAGGAGAMGGAPGNQQHIATG